MTFRISGLDPAPFRHLFGLTDDELASKGVRRYIANAKPGFPDRVEVRDLEPGEAALLLNFTHQPADNPYKASHAIFVREWAEKAYEQVDTIPDVLRVRPLSVRAFDANNMMIDADAVDGSTAEQVITKFFDNPDVSYIHVHTAKRGCYLALVERT
jgi:hypothetical protein